ncbi:MAG: UDP-N-acetylmuramoyl-L-alanyl-D-glutamate--2,6-diaminopimelate ligase [Oscillospiraceae bacterium]|nr:UDP-N-acetylmuramoyl-L-alanyl-D-glutamate--2,6-diaminopimelate ligase [Oscillospiraceae bacterium]
MKLKDLLKDVEILSAPADVHLQITGISYDSRTVQPGDLFVAIRGEADDGGRYVMQAMERGAVCTVTEVPLSEAVPHVIVSSCRRALAQISANWFGHPAREMTLVGVTGTNGKTTVTYLIKQILEERAGAKVGLIGTICNMVGQEELSAERTTPDAWHMQRLLRHMADSGCTHVVMEVSSHALALDRVHGVRFHAAVFTNLTQDHLDFHQTMETYCDAKSRLFHNCDLAVYNADDPWSQRLLSGCLCRRFSYGRGPAQLRGENIALFADHVQYTAQSAQQSIAVHGAIPGLFSVYNTLAAMAVCQNLGVPAEDCAAVLRHCCGARGRMEVVPTPGKPYTVLIDYAHTPDALENVLTAVRGFAKGRTVALFGCGGDRDRTKRPLMGKIVSALADYAIVTTDNPRTEEPSAIIADILAGMSGGAYCVVENRVRAIHRALDHAEEGDVVVLCGKGHEDYQEIGHTKYPLDERQVVAAYLAGQN